MLSLFRKNLLICLLLLLYAVSGVFFMIWVPKGDEVIYLNGNHSETLDNFFFFLTLGGDGVFVIGVTIAFLFVRYYSALVCLSTYLLSAIIVQFLKRILFADWARPKVLLEGKYIIHAARGIEIHQHHTFPSGHSASAFALAISLAFLYPKKYLTVILFATAFLISISRIYLGQHFFMDTFGGALIAFFSCFLLFYFFEVRNSVQSNPLLHKRIGKK